MRLLFSRLGCICNCRCCCRHSAFTILFLLVFVPCWISLTEGRTVMAYSGPSKGAAGWEVAVARVERIGSIPPRCDRKCSSCGPCEAIQVPTNPQESKLSIGRKGSTSPFEVGEFYSRDRGDDDGSNYKPMSWKCKCGKLIFNP